MIYLIVGRIGQILILFILSCLIVSTNVWTGFLDLDRTLAIEEEEDHGSRRIDPDTVRGLLSSPWPMYGKDLKHTSRSDIDTSHQNGTLRWTFPTNGPIYSSPTIDSDGTIYFGNFDKKMFVIYPNGTLKWSYDMPENVQSSATIGDDGTIYIGCRDNKLYAFHPNGTMKANFSTGGAIISAVALLENDTMYFGSMDGRLYAIDTNMSLKWSHLTGNGIYSSPAVADNGDIYVGSTDGYLYSISPSGTRNWRFRTGHRILSSPAIDENGDIYFGSEDSWIYSLYPNGSLKWKWITSYMITSSPAIGLGGMIYIGSYDKYFLAINSTTGIREWSYRTSNWIYGDPTVGGDGSIYFGSSDHYFYSLNRDGKLNWRYQTGGNVNTEPTIDSQGSVYVGSYDGKIYSFGLNDPPVIDHISKGSPTTGELYNFSIGVSDDVGVANSYVEVRYGPDETEVMELDRNGDQWSKEIMVPHDSTVLKVRFMAVDRGRVWGYYPSKNGLLSLDVIDTIPPSIVRIETPFTALIGEDFYVEAWMYDNIGIGSVSITWDHGKNGEVNESMDLKDPNYSFHFLSLGLSFEDLFFQFFVLDTFGNINRSEQKVVKVIDDQKPVILKDMSPKIAHAGEQYDLEVEVSDNHAVLGVWVEYWYPNSGRENISLMGEGQYRLSINIPISNKDTLFYVFHASDLFGNWVHSNIQEIRIKDDQPPVLIEDRSHEFGTTGDNFELIIIITDNFEIREAAVDWTHGTTSLVAQKLSKIDGDMWTAILPLENLTDSLTYSIDISDTSNNILLIPSKRIPVIDNDPPDVTDLSSSNGTTGDNYTIHFHVEDNIKIHRVALDWKHGSLEGKNITLSGGFERGIEIILDNDIEDLEYRVTTTDNNSNTLITRWFQKPIIDNDPPTIVECKTTVRTEDSIINVKVRSVDNIDVADVQIFFKYGGRGYLNRTMEKTDNSYYSYDVEIDGSDSQFYYYIVSRDTSNNTITGEVNEIQFNDGNHLLFIIIIVVISIIFFSGVVAFMIINKRLFSRDDNGLNGDQDTTSADNSKFYEQYHQ